ncbi:MAG: hypothetical protein WA364_28890 [Candidatus Nitrosopolaris sp.]
MQRITSRVNRTTGNRSESLRTVVPQVVVRKMGLSAFDMIEWILQKKGDFIVRKL